MFPKYNIWGDVIYFEVFLINLDKRHHSTFLLKNSIYMPTIIYDMQAIISTSSSTYFPPFMLNHLLGNGQIHALF